MNKLVAKTIILFFVALIFLPTFALADDLPSPVASTTEILLTESGTTTPEVSDTDVLTLELVDDTSTTTTATTTDAVGDSLTEEVVEDVVITDVESDASEPIYISGEITEDQIWTAEDGPYYLSDLVVPAGVTLTIMPGTVVYASGFVAVFGVLDVRGSSENHISINQDSGSSWYISSFSGSRMDISFADMYGAEGIFVDGADLSLSHIHYIDATDGILINNGGLFSADYLNISGLYDATAVTALNQSSLSITNSEIETFGETYAVAGYANSKVSIISSTISPLDGTAIIMLGGSLDLDRATLRDSTDNGIELYPYQVGGYIRPKANITNSTISGFRGAIFAIDPDLNISDSKLEDNRVGIEMYVRREFSANLKQTSFDLNDTGVIFFRQEYGAVGTFDATNNWWGDAMGPYEPTRNPSGLGDKIDTYNSSSIDYLDYDPWLTSPPGTRNPVIIIPGIMGSYLNRNDNAKTPVWINKPKLVSPSDDFLDELIMDELGQPDTSNPIMLPTDIFRSENGTNFFQGLIDRLISEGYKEGVDLFVFPYDWRLDIRSVANNLYSPALTSLSNEVDTVLDETGAEKVNIIAHSMGGLLAKNYIKHYGQAKVDKFVDIASPHLGAPEAAKILVYGDDLDIGKYIFTINPEEIKKISQNMPAVYQLLPSRQYFSTTSPDYSYYLYDIGDLDGDGIKGRLNFSQSTDFLKDTGRNSFLLQLADGTHQDLDDFSPSDYEVDAYNIVGCGTPTIGKIFTNIKKNKKDYEYQIQYINGDGTVPQRSAEYLLTPHLFYTSGGIEHATMPSNTGVSNLITSILKGSVDSFDYTSNSNIASSTAGCRLPNGKYMSFHSPVAVHIYGTEGNHTGPDENGDIEYGIPGVTYDVIEDNKFIFIPEGEYSVKLVATGDGTFDARVKYSVDGLVTSTSYFNNVGIIGGVSEAEVKYGSSNPRIILDEHNDDKTVTIYPTSITQGDSLDNIEITIESPEEEPNIETILQSPSAGGAQGYTATTGTVAGSSTVATSTVSNNPVTYEEVENQPQLITDDAESDKLNDAEDDSIEINQLASVADTGFFSRLIDYVYNRIIDLYNWIFK